MPVTPIDFNAQTDPFDHADQNAAYSPDLLAVNPNVGLQSDSSSSFGIAPDGPGGADTFQAPVTWNMDNASGLRSKIVSDAMSQIGVPYNWGGTQWGVGLDCSGLVMDAFGKVGVHLPRISYQQANSGTRTSLKNLVAGDLVAWDENDRNNGADHIAIFAGYKNGVPYVIEAPHTGADVRYRAVSAKESGIYGVHLHLKGDK